MLVDLLEAGAELTLEHGLHLLERHRWNVVLQLLQFLDDVRGHQIRARGHDLSELDERRSKFGEGEADTFGATDRPLVGVCVLLSVAQRGGPAGALNELPEAVSNENTHDLAQAFEIAYGRDDGAHGAPSISDWQVLAILGPVRHQLGAAYRPGRYRIHG